MPGYNTAYQIAFKDTDDKLWEANIYDTTTYNALLSDQSFIKLKGGADPVHVSTLDEEEEKFTVIKAKQASIIFKSTEQYDLNTFADGEDDRWKAEIYFASQLVFVGYLVLNDMDEDFHCKPNEVLLTANDNLGLLKDEPLVNANDQNPKGNQTVIQFIAWALRKTNLNLNINIVFNLKQQQNGFQHPFNADFLDAKTFEDEIGVSIDSYQALERILGQNCFLEQRNGEWWIVRIDEMDGTPLIITKYSSEGAYLSSDSIDDYFKTIIKTGSLKWVDVQTYITLDRPYKHVKETYKFSYPKEVIDNIDFSRGNILPLAPGPNMFAYALDDWTIYASTLHSETTFWASPTTVSANAYIVRKFDTYNTEQERYVRTDVNSGGTYHYLQSSQIPVKAKDKFRISIDIRLEGNVSSNPHDFEFAVVLFADDNTTQAWTAHTGVASADDDRAWQTVTMTAEELAEQYPSSFADGIPKDGYLVLYLPFNQYGLNPGQRANFSNLSFEYNPYINGSYRKFDGQHWKISQPGNYKAKHEEEVFITDSPRRLFKGAIQRFDVPTGKYKLSDGWYDSRLTSSPTTADIHPFGWFQAFAVWNQKNRVMRIADGKLKGATEGDLEDLTHLYILGDQSPHSENRYFMCLHYDLSAKYRKWTGYFIEVIKTDVPKTYTDTAEFKYLENRDR